MYYYYYDVTLFPFKKKGVGLSIAQLTSFFREFTIIIFMLVFYQFIITSHLTLHYSLYHFLSFWLMVLLTFSKTTG